MRVFTEEQRKMMENSAMFKLLSASRPPDRTKLEKESSTFARWISRQHAKERARLAQAPA